MLEKAIGRFGFTLLLALACTGAGAAAARPAGGLTYPIVDTAQTRCYSASGTPTACPDPHEALFGQDAQTTGNTPAYIDNGDGTVTDRVTGLMWQKSPDTDGDGAIDASGKLTYEQAQAHTESLELGGHTDWRLPTIKELYSLILFDGTDPSGLREGAATLVPFIDHRVFDFAYGGTDAGERLIDAQYASSTLYVSTTNGMETLFGVNFADGRIKGYGLRVHGRDKTFFVLAVRGNPAYGENDFAAGGDGTVTDNATGLMWQRDDSGAGLDWPQALATCESFDLAGHENWRLPNAKELQSLVDYNRSPDTTGSAAIDPIFESSLIANEAGQIDFPAYWSSTTHANLQNGRGAAYVNLGRSMGYMNGSWIDVHGAGAQRSDPKTGDPAEYPTGHGPQGDAIRIENYVRCVRGGTAVATTAGDAGIARQGLDVESNGDDLERRPGEVSEPDRGPGPRRGGRPSGPPPEEAIGACTGKSAGTACAFTAPHGRLAGTCRSIAGRLACVPAR